MRRTKLIWFAAGAAAATLFSLFANWFLQPTVIKHGRTAYIVLTEPHSEKQPIVGEPASNNEMIANQTGSILRDCGATVFETTFLYNDHAPTADFPIIRENHSSLDCVIKAINDQGIHFEIETRNSPRAADEMRSEE